MPTVLISGQSLWTWRSLKPPALAAWSSKSPATEQAVSTLPASTTAASIATKQDTPDEVVVTYFDAICSNSASDSEAPIGLAEEASPAESYARYPLISNEPVQSQSFGQEYPDDSKATNDSIAFCSAVADASDEDCAAYANFVLGPDGVMSCADQHQPGAQFIDQRVGEHERRRPECIRDDDPRRYQRVLPAIRAVRAAARPG